MRTLKRWIARTAWERRVLSMLASLSLFAGALDAHAYRGLKSPKVPKGHPRVYITKAELPQIKKNLRSSDLSESWEMLRKRQDSLALAFIYLVTKEREAGRKAIERWMRRMSGALVEQEPGKDTLTTIGRTPGNLLHVGACVYDWCYDLLSPEERNECVELFVRAAQTHWPGVPISKPAGGVAGHAGEGWLLTGQLPVGIAIHDEYPQMYRDAAALFFNYFVPVRNFIYSAHMHHQGSSYGTERFVHSLAATWLFRRLGTPAFINEQQQFMPYQSLYGLRPDGQQLRRGDSSDYPFNGALVMLLAGAYYQNPVLIQAYDDKLFSTRKHQEPSSLYLVMELLFREPGLPAKKLDNLPLTKYFPSPMGHMIARTGWGRGIDSPDAIVHMNMSEYNFGNHQHADSGSFQIYYRGALAVPSGVYLGYGSRHHSYYYQRTLSKNALLIYDPSEQYVRRGRNRPNDSGQIFSGGGGVPKGIEDIIKGDFKVASVTDHAFGPDPQEPKYSFLAGDITSAYSQQKAAGVTRSMVAFNTGNKLRPCIFVVFDRVATTDPAYKKTWLLHSIQEPSVDGRFVTIVRDGPGYRSQSSGHYGGKLVVERLLPEQADVNKIGGPGKEFWMDCFGENVVPEAKAGRDLTGIQGYREAGAWRIETSPAQPSQVDRFLHVMTVMDKDTPAPEPCQRFETEHVVGAVCEGYGVVFTKGTQEMRALDIEIPGKERTQLLVTGLRPGKWLVKGAGGEVTRAEVTAEGRCLFVHVEPGRLVLRRK